MNEPMPSNAKDSTLRKSRRVVRRRSKQLDEDDATAIGKENLSDSGHYAEQKGDVLEKMSTDNKTPSIVVSQNTTNDENRKETEGIVAEIAGTELDEDDEVVESSVVDQENEKEEAERELVAKTEEEKLILETESCHVTHEWPEPLDDLVHINGEDWPVLNSQNNGNVDKDDGENGDALTETPVAVPATECNDTEKWIRRNQKIAIRTVTWNLAAKPPPPASETRSTLFPQNKYHVIAVGTEECERSIAASAVNPTKKVWESYLVEALGDQYIPIKSHALQAIHLMLFVHKDIKHLCYEVHSAVIPTGIANTLGNKGAVAISVVIGYTKFVFVNAHLAAHQNAVKARNNECLKIDAEMPGQLSRKFKRLTGQATSNRSSFRSAKSVSEAEVGSIKEGIEEGEKEGGVDTVAATPATPIVESVGIDEKRAYHSSSTNESIDTKEAAAVPLDSFMNSNNNNNNNNNNNEIGLETSTTIPMSTVSTKTTDGLPKSLAECGDRVVFMGDLNYRIRGDRASVDKMLAHNMYEPLHAKDQLVWTKEEGTEVLKEFIGRSPILFLIQTQITYI